MTAKDLNIGTGSLYRKALSDRCHEELYHHSINDPLGDFAVWASRRVEPR